MPTKQNPPKLAGTAELRELFADRKNIDAFSQLFEDAVPTWPPDFHKDIYATLTDPDRNGGVAAPRGFAKSTIADLVVLAWKALHGHLNFGILVSDTYTQSVMLLEALRSELQTNPHILEIYGDVVGTKWTMDEVIIQGLDAAGNRTTCKIIARGAGMKIRGLRYLHYRPQYILCDDLENDEQVRSDDRREKLYNWFTKALLPALDRNTGRVAIIGTILHRESLLAKVTEGRDLFKEWNRLKFKALDSDSKSIWPDVVPTNHLEAMRDDPIKARQLGVQYLGAVGFSQEMQNEPMDEGTRIVKPAWLENNEENPYTRYSLQDALHRFARAHSKPVDLNTLRQWMTAHFSEVVGHVDPAISEKQTADYFAMVTVGITSKCPFCKGNPAGHIVCLDYFRMRESDLDRQVSAILDHFKDWQHTRIKVETVAFQQGLYAMVRKYGAERKIYPTVVPWKPDKDKVRRATMHSANFSGRLVHIRSDHELAGAFVDEIVQFPQGAHDDLFDAYMGASENTVLRVRGRTFRTKPIGF